MRGNKPSAAAIGRRLYPQQGMPNPMPRQGDNGRPSQGMNSPMNAILAALAMKARMGQGQQGGQQGGPQAGIPPMGLMGPMGTMMPEGMMPPGVPPGVLGLTGPPQAGPQPLGFGQVKPGTNPWGV